MIYVLGALFLLLAFLLICAILLQEGKGGGLAAMSGAVTDSVMGAKNPMRRLTVYLFVFFIVVVLALNYSINQENSGDIAPGLVQPVTAPVALPPLAETPADGGKPAADAAAPRENPVPASVPTATEPAEPGN